MYTGSTGLYLLRILRFTFFVQGIKTRRTSARAHCCFQNTGCPSIHHKYEHTRSCDYAGKYTYGYIPPDMSVFQNLETTRTSGKFENAVMGTHEIPKILPIDDHRRKFSPDSLHTLFTKYLASSQNIVPRSCAAALF